MANDPRTYIKVHDGMPDHPKIDGLSDKSFRLLIELWCWCSRHLTDGFVPHSTWSKRGTKRARKELVDAGLVEQNPSGVNMRDYLEHQRSRSEIEALREAKREAGALGGAASARSRRSSKRASKTNPETETDTNTESDTEDQDQEDTRFLDFERFWNSYPTRANGSKGSKKLALAAWKNLSQPKREVALERLSAYTAANRGFTKDAERYLKHEMWESVEEPVVQRSELPIL